MTLPVQRISTVLAAAATYDLTDLSTVRDELGLKVTDTSNNAWLARAITQVSRAIERHCKRRFAPEWLQDIIQFGRDPFPGARFAGDNEIALARWPLLAVLSVTQSLPNGIVRTLAAGVDFIVDMSTGCLLRLGRDGRIERWEAIPLTVQYIAGFGDLVIETLPVPAVAPYQVTVSQAASWSVAQSVAYASGEMLKPVGADPAQGQYSVAAGVYTFNVADEGQGLTFSYATFKVPDDLVDVVLQLITGRVAAKGRDPALIQRERPGIGVERFWFGGTPGQDGQFPPDVAAALDEYRVPTVA